MKIAVALSGGVDSSVAALILRRDGHEVIGLTMTLGPLSEGSSAGASGWADASSRVARSLGIPHHVVDVGEEFDRSVVAAFVSDYTRGRTPNPCVVCNSLIKFGRLMREASALGAERLATGHHARVTTESFGTNRALRRGRDVAKDQSYFLYRLTQEQLSRTLMPVGEITKDEARALAAAAGLALADRPESADACFVPSGDIASFIEQRAPEAARPGPIEDLGGNVIGEHRGIAFYTVGQRSGLGLSRPLPTYVVAIRPNSNTIVVGDEADLYADTLAASELHWISGSPLSGRFAASAKIRYAAPPATCTVELKGDSARVRLDAPVRAVTPGQAVVFYDGDRVLGGGVVSP